MKLPETKYTREQIKNLTPEQYRAEVERLKKIVIDDFRREMNSHRTAGVSLARQDGTAEPDHDCLNCL